jgi:hypothetical protein
MAGWLYDRRLLYPERAEALGDDFADYRVTLEHWSALSKAFRDAYQPVWVRKMSRVLIVCGDQGSGKSLFCRRLAMDYESTRKALQASRTCAPDLANNLWHLLVVDPHDRAPPEEAIEVTTRDTSIRTVQEHAGWLDELRQWGKADTSRVRVVVFDNFHRERFLADLAGVPIDVYVQRREAGQESGLLPLVAQSLVDLARKDLLRAVFVCLANDRPLMEQLVRAIEREHRELPQLHATPQPPAPIKEKIVRSNLNRLNNISYWYSLDRAAPDARVQVRDAITGSDGVGRVYELVEQGVALPRSGAPTTPNRLTLVTLGSSPGAVSAKIKASWERLPPKVLHSGQSLGEWVFTRGFARALPARDPDTRRRGELFDSEFNVRWIALGMGATRALVGTPGAPGDLGGMLLDAILSPWTADGSTLAPLEDSASLEAPEITRYTPWGEIAYQLEWTTRDDKALKSTTRAFAEAIEANRGLIPSWFPAAEAQERFLATYPFHPSVLSVFERKWRALPKFQQTRGMLRLLALWVSKAYAEGMRAGGPRDPLIMLGTAPLGDATFRTAVFNQLNELPQLETAVTADIVGRSDSMAVRLDAESSDTVRRDGVHRKAATVIFFESNGGQSTNVATATEVQLAMIEPGRDVVNVNTALDGLVNRCHYLTLERAAYRFSLKPNLNKLLADRRENIKVAAIEARARDEVREVFTSERGVTTALFPTEARQIPDHPRIVFAVLPPDRSLQDAELRAWMERVTRERVYKSAIFWLAPDRGDVITEKARDLLTWQAVGEVDTLSESQQEQLREGRRRAAIDLRRAVWDAYSRALFLGTDQTLREHGYGPLNPSGSDRLLDGLLQNLQTYSVIERNASPGFLLRKWPPAVTEWSTRAVRDVFFQSPEFPRLLSGDSVRDMIARGVSSGDFALVTRAPSGGYALFKWKDTLSVADIPIDDDTFLLRGDEARNYQDAQGPSKKPSPEAEVRPTGRSSPTVRSVSEADKSTVGPTRGQAQRARWEGDLPPLQWMKFYQKVLTPFIPSGGVSLRLSIEIAPRGGLSQHQLEELKQQLEALGLSPRIDTE